MALSISLLTSPTSAQWPYGPGVLGYGVISGGYGPALGVGGLGSGGYGGNPSLGGSYGFGAIGYPYGAFAGSAGVPFQSSINAYNLGYGNTVGIGLVPPAYVGTGTAGIGPVGIGGTNPLFSLGLSPLAINNAVAEQALRRTVRPGSPSGGSGVSIRTRFLPTATPAGLPPLLVPPVSPATSTGLSLPPTIPR